MAAFEQAGAMLSGGSHPSSCRCAGCFGGASLGDLSGPHPTGCQCNGCTSGITTTGNTGFFAGLSNWFSQMFGSARRAFQPGNFSPESDLMSTPGVDPRLVPRTPMNAEGIDAGTLAVISAQAGLRHGKLITAESHPELFAGWQTLCARAGMPKAPQLILADSPTINAITLSPEEVVVTTGLFKILNLREVMAVLGHELGHERYGSAHENTRSAAYWASTAAGAFGGNLLGNAWHRNAVIEAPHPWKPTPGLIGYWGLVSGGAYVGNVVGNQMSVRPTELQADLEGAAISGDPEALISALEKFDRVLAAQPKPKNPIEWWRSTAQFRSGYPSMRERITHLKEALARMPQPNLPAPIVTASEAPSNQPGSKVNSGSITVAERVYFAPKATANLVH